MSRTAAATTSGRTRSRRAARGFQRFAAAPRTRRRRCGRLLGRRDSRHLLRNSPEPTSSWASRRPTAAPTASVTSPTNRRNPRRTRRRSTRRRRSTSRRRSRLRRRRASPPSPRPITLRRRPNSESGCVGAAPSLRRDRRERGAQALRQEICAALERRRARPDAVRRRQRDGAVGGDADAPRLGLCGEDERARSHARRHDARLGRHADAARRAKVAAAAAPRRAPARRWSRGRRGRPGPRRRGSTSSGATPCSTRWRQRRRRARSRRSARARCADGLPPAERRRGHGGPRARRPRAHGRRRLDDFAAARARRDARLGSKASAAAARVADSRRRRTRGSPR